MPLVGRRVQSFELPIRMFLLYQNLKGSGQSMRHDHFTRTGPEAQGIQLGCFARQHFQFIEQAFV